MHLLINSQLIHAQEAKISVSERGFRFGDGVFETIAVHAGKPYQWPFHIKRLQAGLKAIRIAQSLDTLKADCQKLLAANQITDGLLRIYISRGQGGRGYMPDATASALVVIEAMPHTFALLPPVEMWLSRYEKISPKALPVQYKLAQGMQSTLTTMEAADNQCADALLLSADGYVCETTCGNIFWLQNETLYTPSLDCGALDGSTRHMLMHLSPWKVEEGAYMLDALKQAEAVIITNCRIKAQSVARLLPSGDAWEGQNFAAKCYHLLIKDILQSN